MFEIGSYVVKAGEGVCRIDSVIMMDVPGGKNQLPYFLLAPVTDPKIRVYLPVEGDHSDVRSVMPPEKARELLSDLGSAETLEIPFEKIREQVYRDALRSCEPEKIISLLKTLLVRKNNRLAQGKRGTALDERYLSLAEKALCSELAFVLSGKEEEIRAEVRAGLTGEG